jgi:hypothetical protein
MNTGWKTLPGGRRYRDPMRVILSVDQGAGSDRLSLECGHDVVKSHTHLWGKRTGCHQCREWEDKS